MIHVNFGGVLFKTDLKEQPAKRAIKKTEQKIPWGSYNVRNPLDLTRATVGLRCYISVKNTTA